MKTFYLNFARVFGVALLTALLAECVAAAEAAKTNAAPRIEFSELIHDFGKVTTTEPLRHDFIVTNTGNAVLQILEVKPGCGCTTAGTWDKEIQPGKTGRIPIQFNPANYSGPVTKSVTITCNDPAKSISSLQLKADIWKALDIQPTYVQFLPVEDEATNETRIVKITNRTDDPLTLELQSASNPAFKTELKTVQPNKEFELHITFAGSTLTNIGSISSQISLKTSWPNQPVVSFSAFAMLRQAVTISPNVLNLPARQSMAAYKQSAFVMNNSSTPVKLTEASVNAEGVKVQINESTPGKTFSLTIEYPEGFNPAPGTPLELKVKTTHPKRPIVSANILVMGPPPGTPAAKATGTK
ncbi:MAG: DUF1573 domain-containing protein [Verrucomicrobia bacterium]|nr:DUF1573 domain-containing protein [Verrucomicrobiota bacterium]